ncbi:hypothetical protein AGLY_011892 [Aphis glycines]|uniref:Uncharacterized protein n=1 Tax=Aphis glycines TaxID=307491 RepID=A0A6G0TBG9_APHGL|nr:hypothetical protein AGLY_011892 [Aphis glycines]
MDSKLTYVLYKHLQSAYLELNTFLYKIGNWLNKHALLHGKLSNSVQLPINIHLFEYKVYLLLISITFQSQQKNVFKLRITCKIFLDDSLCEALYIDTFSCDCDKSSNIYNFHSSIKCISKHYLYIKIFGFKFKINKQLAQRKFLFMFLLTSLFHIENVGVKCASKSAIFISLTSEHAYYEIHKKRINWSNLNSDSKKNKTSITFLNALEKNLNFNYIETHNDTFLQFSKIKINIVAAAYLADLYLIALCRGQTLF